MYQTILFDLDGTLTDSGIGITNSVMYALEKFDIHVPDRTELYSFIGPPLLESFKRYYGFDHQQAEKAVNYYREYFSRKGIYENYPYDGIKELLAELRTSGKVLLVATSKLEQFAEKVLKHFELYDYFDVVAGSEVDGTRTGKGEIIKYALERSEAARKESAIMVGDREHDILGAKEAGIDSLGVLYGYGSREELDMAGADFVAEDVQSLMRIFFEE